MQENRTTRLKRILEETKEEDGEAEIRERMQMLSSQLIDSITNLHEVFSSQIFVATCRGLWDRMGQVSTLYSISTFWTILWLIRCEPCLYSLNYGAAMPDCFEVSRGQERKPSMVQWILLCSCGTCLYLFSDPIYVCHCQTAGNFSLSSKHKLFS